jgi:hypothetical protein
LLIPSSLKQGSGFVENLVVLCASDGDAQTGIDAAVEFLRSALERFETAAARLTLRYAADGGLAKDIDKFVRGCRWICMGSYTWRWVLARDTKR